MLLRIYCILYWFPPRLKHRHRNLKNINGVHALAHIVEQHLENDACAPSSCNVREYGFKLS
jgi:hypothetical protein